MAATDNPLAPLLDAFEARWRQVLANPPPEFVQALARQVAVELRAGTTTPPAEPLDIILSKKPDAVRMMERRYPDLRALSVGQVGRRRLYRREDVLAWIAGRKGPTEAQGRPTLRAVGGGR